MAQSGLTLKKVQFYKLSTNRLFLFYSVYISVYVMECIMFIQIFCSVLENKFF